MENLPVELGQRILAYLDLDTLRNAALSCRRFLEAFTGAQDLIVGEILLREIHPDVLPEALLVNISWNHGAPSVEKAIQFARENIRRREPVSSKWHFIDAFPLVKFHEKVRYLAAQAADDAFRRHPRLTTMGQPNLPSPEELRRFERTLYRFQLYCNVIGGFLPDDPNDLEDMFFDHFATWENEQLACIQEHLMRLVAKPFNYLVDHDVTWGYLKVPYIDRHGSDEARAVLSEGIDKIYRLAQASTYEQYHALLSRGEDRFSEPLRLAVFVDYGIEKGANPLFPPFLPLEELNDEDKRFVISKPFYNDPDPGPASMWEWVYRDFFPGELVGSPFMRVFRQWAFPLWDHSRLTTTGILGDSDIPGDLINSELEFEEYCIPSRLEFLEQTQNARTEIWKMAGHGWYNHKDKRRIEYTPFDIDPSLQFNYIKPNTLEAAKAFWAGYRDYVQQSETWNAARANSDGG
ncbi:hypothetical protein F5Y18DRAFT_345125 [Xylariaceae sp. FL1019]|nr:hypothetical protein F5Y18DRAFT_345125 [Xylariaceae sp. FL1019]